MSDSNKKEETKEDNKTEQKEETKEETKEDNKTEQKEDTTIINERLSNIETMVTTLLQKALNDGKTEIKKVNEEIINGISEDI